MSRVLRDPNGIGKLKKEQSEVRQRIRWEKPLVWLEELEYNKH
jgi:hypothetical protein